MTIVRGGKFIPPDQRKKLKTHNAKFLFNVNNAKKINTRLVVERILSNNVLYLSQIHVSKSFCVFFLYQIVKFNKNSMIRTIR